MKLKTLKDLAEYARDSPKGGILFEKDLKQEAIKRYEHYFYLAHNFDKQGLNEDKEFCLGHCSEIKDFNNLTEEDLK